MNWSQVCEDKRLQDLPFKIELNEWGNITMSPASNQHGNLQAKIITLLARSKVEGEIISECSIETSKGVKVADVAWLSKDFAKQFGLETPYRQSPDIMIEIMSPSNSDEEMKEKRELYLAKGAKEVWLCREDSTFKFYSYSGEIRYSSIIPEFPSAI